MITIQAFQRSLLNSNPQNLLQYQFKNHLQIFKLLRTDKLDTSQCKIVSSSDFLFYGKFLSLPTKNFAILKECKEAIMKIGTI